MKQSGINAVKAEDRRSVKGNFMHLSLPVPTPLSECGQQPREHPDSFSFLALTLISMKIISPAWIPAVV